MKINCSINGQSIPKKRARISIFDNSLFYADGLFETFAAIGDNVIFIEDHLDRLERGARLIRLALPCSRDRIRRWIMAANKKNTAPIKKIRVTLTAGDSAFWAGKKSKPRILIIVTEYSFPIQPFRLTVSPYQVDQDSPFRNVKTLSFIIEMTSRKKAYSSRFDDGILLNRSGNVAETTSANIFWVKNGILFTTPLEAGCLDGMTRKHIIEMAEHRNIPCRIRNIKLNDLLKADEVFVTSSLKLIIPVISIKAEKTYKFRVGPLTLELKKMFLDYIEARNR